MTEIHRIFFQRECKEVHYHREFHANSPDSRRKSRSASITSSSSAPASHEVTLHVPQTSHSNSASPTPSIQSNYFVSLSLLFRMYPALCQSRSHHHSLFNPISSFSTAALTPTTTKGSASATPWLPHSLTVSDSSSRRHLHEVVIAVLRLFLFSLSLVLASCSEKRRRFQISPVYIAPVVSLFTSLILHSYHKFPFRMINLLIIFTPITQEHCMTSHKRLQGYGRSFHIFICHVVLAYWRRRESPRLQHDILLRFQMRIRKKGKTSPLQLSNYSQPRKVQLFWFSAYTSTSHYHHHQISFMFASTSLIALSRTPSSCSYDYTAISEARGWKQEERASCESVFLCVERPFLVTLVMIIIRRAEDEEEKRQ